MVIAMLRKYAVENCPACGERHRTLTVEDCRNRQKLEKSFQDQVIRRARKYGWRVIHFHAAIVGFDAQGAPIIATPTSGDAKGAPDLVLVKPGRPVIWAELKRELGHLSPEQEVWIDVLTAAGQVALIWRPSQLKEIERVLRG